MSKSKVDCDGFQVVNKRFSRNKQTKIPRKYSFTEIEQVNIDTEKSKARILTAFEDLKISKYFEGVIKSVSKVLESRKVVEIVCLGLGHIGECNISRHQLAFLLCLKNWLNPNKVLVHDPIFYKAECDILRQLDLELIEENSEGGYVISDKQITLVYLPHCPKQLTNNFLWSNWGLNLENCMVMCNSFTSLIDNNPSRIVSETVPYIHKIFPYTSEIVFENNFTYTDIFNDTSLHWFSNEKISKIDSNFWGKGDKPYYGDTEEFITSLMIQKLNI